MGLGHFQVLAEARSRPFKFEPLRTRASSYPIVPARTQRNSQYQPVGVGAVLSGWPGIKTSPSRRKARTASTQLSAEEGRRQPRPRPGPARPGGSGPAGRPSRRPPSRAARRLNSDSEIVMMAAPAGLQDHDLGVRSGPLPSGSSWRVPARPGSGRGAQPTAMRA